MICGIETYDTNAYHYRIKAIERFCIYFPRPPNWLFCPSEHVMEKLSRGAAMSESIADFPVQEIPSTMRWIWFVQ